MSYIFTCKTPAFGGIFLALRGSGAFGAAFVTHSVPPLGRLRHPFGKEIIIKYINNTRSGGDKKKSHEDSEYVLGF